MLRCSRRRRGRLWICRWLMWIGWRTCFGRVSSWGGITVGSASLWLLIPCQPVSLPNISPMILFYIRSHASLSFTAVARFALSCGLNEISDPETYVAQGGGGLLGPVRDVVHFAERVNLWWGIFLLDRRLGFATGLPPTIKEEDSKVPSFLESANASYSLLIRRSD